MALKYLKEEIDAYREEGSDDLIYEIYDELTDSLLSGDQFLAAGTRHGDGSFSYSLLAGVDEDGGSVTKVIGIYTSEAEAALREKSEHSADTDSITLSRVVYHALFSDDIDAVVIDPFSSRFEMNREILWGLYYKTPEDSHAGLFERRMIGKAIRFASEMHDHQVRKGTNEPYITHPLEVLTILNSTSVFDMSWELMAAGVLHDTVEDTAADIDTIRSLFGPNVAGLVAFHTEDKSRSWDERKSHTIDCLETADLREKLLIAADLLSNERSMLRDLRLVGEELWNRFKATKEKMAWYHAGLIEGLSELTEYPQTEGIYSELQRNYRELFEEVAQTYGAEEAEASAARAGEDSEEGRE